LISKIPDPLAAAARDYEFREGVERGMSAIQHVRELQVSSDSLSFDNRSINEDVETDDTEDSVPKIKISILMCAYNEHRTIGRAVREVLAADYPCEVELIVVDDGSKDSTAEIVAKNADPRIILHKHAQNMGKGAALRTAASLATGTHLLPFDADLEYSPKDIPRLVEPLLTGRFDVVYGTRLFGYNTVYQSFRYAVGNRVLTTLTNMMFDSYLSDMHTCLKLMPLSLFNSLSLSENGFGLDTEVTATLLRLGFRPFEVPVSYYSRSHAQGKKINWRDALACLRILIGVRFKKKSKLILSTAEQPEPKDLLFAPMLTEPAPDAEFAALDTFDSTDLISNDVGAVAAG
jgi:dolichol-phosphate hexosyltransferase